MKTGAGSIRYMKYYLMSVKSMLTLAGQTWRQLERDWKAVVLGLFVMILVLAGISIPW
ncbi:hypothetical protein ACFQJ8_18570 [Halocatena marina]